MAGSEGERAGAGELVDLASGDVVVQHRAPQEVAAAFERAGRDEELEARDDWPFG